MMSISFPVLLTVLCPPIGIIAGYWKLFENKVNWKSCAFCLALFMAAFAYCYVPYGEPDLVRYFDYVNQIKDLPFLEAIGHGMRGESNLVLFAAFCWFIGQTGDLHLLPAITVFVIYYIGIYVTCVISEDLKISKKILASYITFIILCPNFYAIINNIRNVFSFAIIGFAVFRDCYQKKINALTILMYVIPIFIHPSSVVMILIRFLILLTGKFKTISFLLIFAIKPMVDLAYSMIGLIPGTSLLSGAIRDAIARAYRYFNDTSSTWGLIVQNSGSQRLMKIFYITLAVVICINAVIISRKNILEKIKDNTEVQNYDLKIKKMIDYAFSIGLLTISCAPMLTPEYWRFVSALILFSGGIYFVGKKYINEGILCLFNESIFVFILPCVILWIRELQKAHLETLLFKPFVSSPIIVLFIDIINLLFS